MALFGFGKKNEEDYDFIFDNGDDAGFDYSDPDEWADEKDEDEDGSYEEIFDPFVEYEQYKQQVAADFKGIVLRGDCPACNGKDTADLQGEYFVCSECGERFYEDDYYLWLNGDYFDICD